MNAGPQSGLSSMCWREPETEPLIHSPEHKILHTWGIVCAREQTPRRAADAAENSPNILYSVKQSYTVNDKGFKFHGTTVLPESVIMDWCSVYKASFFISAFWAISPLKLPSVELKCYICLHYSSPRPLCFTEASRYKQNLMHDEAFLTWSNEDKSF